MSKIALLRDIRPSAPQLTNFHSPKNWPTFRLPRVSQNAKERGSHCFGNARKIKTLLPNIVLRDPAVSEQRSADVVELYPTHLVLRLKGLHDSHFVAYVL